MAIGKKMAEKNNKISCPGFQAASVSSGLKKGGQLDLALVLSETSARVAGVFTKNTVKAAPVLLDIERLKRPTLRGIVVNSGNANACTGVEGEYCALKTATVVEKEVGLEAGEILVASTGVIGVPLPIEKVVSAAPGLVRSLSPKPGAWRDASRAMMTTDAFAKSASVSAVIGGEEVTIAAVAKGAGMIRPDMATMLAFFFTDANIGKAALKSALKESVARSFNSISVDNDMSTNDTALIFANALSSAREIKADSKDHRAFKALLTELSVDVAKMIVRDGEGAKHFIEINLKGAASEAEAKKAAWAIADSMLVKTAFAGGDPNWGRIIAAVGASGVKMKPDNFDITLNGVRVASGGIDTKKERQAARAIKTQEVILECDLKSGRSGATVWTSDLTADYVKINSEYRT